MTTETAPAGRITLPGGEMLAWSDLPQERLADGGPLAALAARIVPAGARVLLAGPHDPALLDRLAHAEVTCLLRSHLDAVALAQRAARVVVGGPAGLPDDETYDVVIAGAGLDPVESVEGTRLGWDGVLARLAGAVRPGGALLLHLGNPLGLHRLVSTTPWYAGRDNSAWVIGGVLDQAHPANRDQLRTRLADAGLRPTTCWAEYPATGTATALLDADQLDRGAGSGLFDAVLHGACAGGFTTGTVLQDPARLAVDALHAGRAADLAPGWLMLAHRPDGGEATPVADADLPVALVQTGRTGIGVLEVLDGPSGWRWGLAAPTGANVPAAAPFASREAAYRDPGALTGPVPSGRLLRTLLLDAALRRDLTTLRTLLHGYAGWLADQADDDGRIGGAAALASTDNVVVADGRYAVLDPSWRATAALPGDVVLAAGCGASPRACSPAATPTLVVHSRRGRPDRGARRPRGARPGSRDRRPGGRGRGRDRRRAARAGPRRSAQPRHRAARRRTDRPAGGYAQLPATARGMAAPARGDHPTRRTDQVDRRAAHLAGTGAAPGRIEDQPAQRVDQLPGRPARHHPSPTGQAGRPRRQAAGPLGTRPKQQEQQ
ncbi:hypothetical protein GCM10027614_73050 [Micromonospora vulcania]